MNHSPNLHVPAFLTRSVREKLKETIARETDSPKMILTYSVSEPNGSERVLTFMLNMDSSFSRDKLLKTVTWAAKAGVRLYMIPVSEIDKLADEETESTTA